MADNEKKVTQDSKVEKAATEESKAASKVAKAAKGNSKKSKKSVTGGWDKVKKFFKDYKGERKKIVWPDAKMVLKSTGVVILVVAIVSLIIFGIDQGLSAGITGLKKLATNETTVSAVADESKAEDSTEAEETKESKKDKKEDSKETTAEAETTAAEATEEEAE